MIKNGLNKIIKINVEAPETDCTGLAFFNRRLKHNIFDVMIKIIRKKQIQNDKVEPNENTFEDYIQLLNAVGATDIYI